MQVFKNKRKDFSAMSTDLAFKFGSNIGVTLQTVSW